MSLSRLDRGADGLRVARTPMARSVRATGRADAARPGWYPAFDRAHRCGAGLMIAALLGCGVLAPATLTGSAGGALLLVGGALIGMPHGSSDFVVAHRLLKPRLPVWWLPAFLAVYLLVTVATLVGWRYVPVGTFVAFLVVSGLHFGAGHDGPDPLGDTALRHLARATTPLVPIFLFHPADVAGIVGLMVGQPTAGVVAVLAEIRPAGLALYAALLAWTVTAALATARQPEASSRSQEAAELALLAAAAYLLPPLLAFAVYFCLLHAVRHMAQLGHARFPRDGHAASRLAAAIVAPSAVVCGLALGLAWDRMAGVLSTEHLLAAALQLTASLTVPHVMLEWWSERQAGSAGT